MFGQWWLASTQSAHQPSMALCSRLLPGLFLYLALAAAPAAACNEAVCASIVSKCMLLQSCKCELQPDCTCCKERSNRSTVGTAAGRPHLQCIFAANNKELA